MASERTVRTLTALLAAMTAGAFALMLMETDTVRPTAEPLAAFGTADGQIPDEVTHPRAIPLQQAKWRNIIIHATGAEGEDIAERCHFVIAPGPDGQPVVHVTDLWHNQLAGHHVYTSDRDFNADSIGICLLGDYQHQPPTQAMMDELVSLTRAVQRTCGIGRQYVYLYRDLDSRSPSPGLAFPIGSFSRRLLAVSQ
ncbi:MAG: peptidoglycan recognition protein family protein [Planctomycetota bacterium]|jgi:N-acetyl-anhydromuramyl-L-alanine amidase AmpD